ncbi:hypothetical protein LCGC14_1551680, partial [marine sediment metagenome]
SELIYTELYGISELKRMLRHRPSGRRKPNRKMAFKKWGCSCPAIFHGILFHEILFK